MKHPMLDRTDDIRRLHNCLEDLITLLDLPNAWAGSDSTTVLGKLLDAVVPMLELDFAYARLGSDESLTRVASGKQSDRAWTADLRTERRHALYRPPAT